MNSWTRLALLNLEFTCDWTIHIDLPGELDCLLRADRKGQTMHSRPTLFRTAPAILIAFASTIHAQTFSSVPAIPFDTAGPVIHAHAESQKPFTVAGERGVILGQQDGAFESWVLPSSCSRTSPSKPTSRATPSHRRESPGR